MSKTIDEKVVQMKFDNSNFEKNVAKTLKTLDNLKWKITETDLESSKGLSKLNKAAKDVDMSGLAKGIETVQARFSALQVIGVTALANLTNSAVNAGKRIVSALGDALVNGGKNRALNIQNAKFQIEGLLGTEEFQKQWKRIDESINWAVKDTAYGYDSAAKAASQFMASNVKVGKEMDYSLRAISGVAAMTNSSYDDIANVFTRVAGQGRVMAIDLNSLAARGMNAAAVLAKHFGKTESQIRDMVSKGKVSFNDFALAMDNAFGEHAKKGNETFQGALDNMKAAMSRIGAKVWDPLLTNQRDVFNQMRLLLNDLNNNYLDGSIKGLNEKLTSVFQNIVKFFELGGMKNILLGIGDILGYIGSVLKPIKDGFRDIFPKKTAEELVEYTKFFKNLTSYLKLSDENAKKIRDTFKGLFSILRVGVDFALALAKGFSRLLSALTGVPGGILGVAQAFGNWLTKIGTAIHESRIFSNVIEGVGDALSKFSNKIKDVLSKLDIFGALVKGFKGIFEFIKQLGSELGLFISTLFKSGNLDLAFKAVNSVFEGGLLVALIRFVNQMKMLTMRSKQFVGNISGTLYQLKETLSALQYSIKASAIMEIAKAMLVLAGALLVLSLIDPVRLGGALTATAIGMGELVGALALLGKFNTTILDAVKMYALVNMIRSLSTSLVILSVALKITSAIDFGQMKVAIFGMSTMLLELVGVIAILSLFKENDVYQATKSMRKMGTALLVISVALKILSTIEWSKMIVAVSGLSAVLWQLVLALKVLPKMDFGKRIASLTGAAFAMVILAGALKILATMNWNDIWRAVAVMGIALAELTTSLLLLGNFGGKSIRAAIALIPASLAMIALAAALNKLGKLDWEEIKKSLIAMGLALAELTAAMVIAGNFKGLTGSFALNGLIGTLIPLAIALKMLGSMDGKQIAKSLIAMASAFTIMGVAGILLGKVAPGLLTAAAAIALFGVSALAIGGGLMLMAAGISALSVALAGGTTVIVASLTAIIIGFINLIPSIIKSIGDGIVIICDALLSAAPKIATTALSIIVEILKALSNDGPLIVKYLAEFIIGILNELALYAPDFIQAVFNVVKAVLEGLGKALQGLDPILSLEGVLGLVGLTGLMYMLSGLGSLIGPAFLGVLALGALISELAVVLAAIGGLAQIPGLKWLVEEGGKFMQAVGIAIGQLIGGIVGGIALGASAALPGIGKNLSDFMSTVQQFINGCRVIDQSVLVGAGILASTIIMMAGAEIYNGIANFMTYGKSMSDIGTQLSKFMENIQGFVEGAKKIDPNILNGVSALTSIITELTTADLVQGITKFLTFGQNGDISKFGKKLPELANHISNFVSNLGEFSENELANVRCAADIIKILSKVSNDIPNTGGMAALFSGDNDISKFGDKLPKLGKHLNKFISNLGEFGEDKLSTVRRFGSIIMILSKVASSIPNEGGMAALFSGDNDISKFGDKLPKLGKHLNNFVSNLGEFGEDKLTTIKCATKAILTLAIAADNIPNTGGMAALFAGDNDISKFGDKLPKLGKHLNNFVSNLGEFGEDKLTTIKCATKAILTLAIAANNVPNTGGMAALFSGDNDISEFADKLPLVGYYLRKFVENIGEFGEDKLTTIKCAAKAILALAIAANNVPNTGGMAALFSGDNDISEFADKLPLVGYYLRKFVENLGEFGEEQVKTSELAIKALGYITDLAGKAQWNDDAPEKLKNMTYVFWDIGEGIKKFIESQKDVSLEDVNAAVEKIKTIMNSLELINGINADNINNFKNCLETIANEGIKAFCESITSEDALGKSRNSAQMFIQEFINAVDGEKENTKNKSKEVTQEAYNGLKDDNLLQQVVNLGKYFVQGFSDGIKNNIYLARDAGSDVGKAALNAAKKSIDAHSPSRESFKLGKYFDQGLANGIKNYMTDVYTAAQNVGDRAKSGLYNAISKISDIINSDINNQPIIRPILDLDNIKNNIGTLNTMLNGSTLAIATNAGAISSNFHGRNQNGNLEVVSAINKLRKDLSNSNGDTYNINGITYDDGTEVSEAVQTLVRAATIERRM